MTKIEIKASVVRKSVAKFFLRIFKQVINDIKRKLPLEKQESFAADDLLPYLIEYIKSNFELKNIDLYEISKMDYKPKKGEFKYAANGYNFLSVQVALMAAKQEQNEELVKEYGTKLKLDTSLINSILSESEDYLKSLDRSDDDMKNQKYEAIISARRCLLRNNTSLGDNIQDFFSIINHNLSLLESDSSAPIKQFLEKVKNLADLIYESDKDNLQIKVSSVLLKYAKKDQDNKGHILDKIIQRIYPDDSEENPLKKSLNDVFDKLPQYMDSLYKTIDEEKSSDFEKDKASARFQIIHDAHLELVRTDRNPVENLNYFFKVLSNNSDILMADKSRSAILFFKAVNLLIKACIRVGIESPYIYQRLFQPLVESNIKFFKNISNVSQNKQDLRDHDSYDDEPPVIKI